jgi:hypothetical protein
MPNVLPATFPLVQKYKALCWRANGVVLCSSDVICYKLIKGWHVDGVPRLTFIENLHVEIFNLFGSGIIDYKQAARFFYAN